MERLVHSYLSQNYVLELEEIPRYSVFLFNGDALYNINDNSKYRSFKNPSQLLSELNTVFFLTYDELKPIILSWAIKLKEDANLDRDWDYIESLLPKTKEIEINFTPREEDSVVHRTIKQWVDTITTPITMNK